MRTIELRLGQDIHRAAEKAVEAARADGAPVRFEFNEVEVIAQPDSSAESVVATYMAECDRRREVYMNSPEYAEAKRRAEEEAEQQRIALEAALVTAPAEMALRDEDGWRKSVEVNSDPYGAAVMRYAELWARLMEGRIASGGTVADVAQETSRLADTEGITGFMYGCAVSILAQVWAHGEELRRWHNIDTQIGDEGERANENGGTLNPALLNIG